VLSYPPAILLGIATVQVACTALLDFEECEVDEHCGDGSVCVAQRCREAQAQVIEVNAPITEDTIWESPNNYVLDGVIYVASGVTLTIRSGVVVRGREGSALVVESGGTLQARGTEFAPIVFTSDKPERERVPGDWGGVALLGRAPVNTAGAVLEGVSETDRAGFGGTDPTWSCGVIEYTRIEFAGFAIEQDEELNGLTLAGCGSGTLISHLQVHYALDDGMSLTASSHASLPTHTTPSPQLADSHVDRQASVSSALPSSHASPGSTLLSPHTGIGPSEEPEPEGSDAVPSASVGPPVAVVEADTAPSSDEVPSPSPVLPELSSVAAVAVPVIVVVVMTPAVNVAPSSIVAPAQAAASGRRTPASTTVRIGPGYVRGAAVASMATDGAAFGWGLGAG